MQVKENNKNTKKRIDNILSGKIVESGYTDGLLLAMCSVIYHAATVNKQYWREVQHHHNLLRCYNHFTLNHSLSEHKYVKTASQHENK